MHVDVFALLKDLHVRTQRMKNNHEWKGKVGISAERRWIDELKIRQQEYVNNSYIG